MAAVHGNQDGPSSYFDHCFAGGEFLQRAGLGRRIHPAVVFDLFLQRGIHRLGPERAAYCTVLFPVVALTISTVFEGYRWNVLAFAGLACVLTGNLLAFIPARLRRRPAIV